MKNRIYHSSIKILAAKDALPENISDLIHRQNIYRWKKQSESRYFGYDLDKIDVIEAFAKNNKALNVMENYLLIANKYASICKSFKNYSKQLAVHKKTIVDFVKDFGTSKIRKSACEIFGISTSTVKKWFNEIYVKCQNSPLFLCKKTYPNQLSAKEYNTMYKLLTEEKFQFWPISSVFYHAIREKLVFACLQTWYNYVKRAGIKRLPWRKKKNFKLGIRADSPNQWWHADITIIKTLDGAKNYLYLIVDNYSRFVINWRLEKKISKQIRLETIKEAYYKYKPNNNEHINLMVDGGTENNNIIVDEFIAKEEILMKKWIAMLDIDFSNSVVEAENKLIKYRYLFRKEYNGYDDLLPDMEKIIQDYNFNRPHVSLNGLTPYEANCGKKVDFGYSEAEKAEIKRNRVIANKLEACKNC